MGLIQNAFGTAQPAPSPWPPSYQHGVARGPVRVVRVQHPPSRHHPPPPHIRSPMAPGGVLLRRPPPAAHQRVVMRDSSGKAQYVDATLLSSRTMPPRHPPPPHPSYQQHRVPMRQPQRYPIPTRPPHPSQRAPRPFQAQPPAPPPPPPERRSDAFETHSSVPASARPRGMLPKSTGGRIQTPYQRRLQEKKQQHQPDSFPRRTLRSQPPDNSVYLDDSVDDDAPEEEAEVRFN